MVSPEMNPTVCWMFEAEIILLFHAKTFHKGFQVTVHVGNVRQTATVQALQGKVRRCSCNHTRQPYTPLSNFCHIVIESTRCTDDRFNYRHILVDITRLKGTISRVITTFFLTVTLIKTTLWMFRARSL